MITRLSVINGNCEDTLQRYCMICQARSHHPIMCIMCVLLPVQDFNSNLSSSKPAILETVVMAEQFGREHQGRLAPEQQEELQHKTDELRKYLDSVEGKTAKLDSETKTNIDHIERELEEEVGASGSQGSVYSYCNSVVFIWLSWTTDLWNVHQAIILLFSANTVMIF